MTDRHIRGTKGFKVERVLGKEEDSEKYSELQMHGVGQILSWSNMLQNNADSSHSNSWCSICLKKKL